MKTALIVLALLAPAVARADVTRHALIVGHDRGHPDEQTLRYAEDDARRLAEVLVDLGGFAADHVTVLRGPAPDAVLDALIAINDRIRTRGEPAVLVVFYSGHADAQALHLGAGELSLERLEQLVRGSAAAFRLLIVDACRSGALTQVKGGAPVPAQPVQLAERLPADGLVVWTSSSATEDAQESDDIQGSFFTHYLVSGLLGAADRNGDGTVSLGEAYAHAYDATLRASSRTLAGVQHATFREDVHGLADLTLTWLDGRARGLVAFPPGHDYLVMMGGPDGPVVAEVGARDAERRVSLRVGRYFVRARTADALLEGTVAVRAGERVAVDEGALKRSDYARLVRKGAGGRARADRVELGYTIRSSLYADAGPCQGATAGWGVDLPAFSLGLRAVACRGGATNAFVDATHDQLAAEARAVHAWDVDHVTLAIGPLAGTALLVEHFTGGASTRTSLAPLAGVTAGASLDLADRLYLTGEVDAVTTFFRQEQMGEASLHAAFAVRGNLLVGMRW
ncbi:MAG TPA: caspase family protein [Kofleriaceae bacterium]